MLTASVHTLSASLAAYARVISIVASALTRPVSDLAVELQRQRPRRQRGMSYIVALYIVLYETACSGAARLGIRRSMARTYGINITAAAADATRRFLATHLPYSQSLVPRWALSRWGI